MKLTLKILVLTLLVFGNASAQIFLSNNNELKKKLLDRIHLKGVKPYEKMAQLNQFTHYLRAAELKMRLDSFVFFDSTASQNTFRSIYVYDAKQRNTVLNFYLWDNLNKKWMGFIHAVFYYNTKNQIIETQSGDWNSQTNSFDINSKVLNEYNSKGILVKDSSYIFDSGIWSLDEKSEYTIINDKVAVAVVSDHDGMSWVNYSKNVYQYDGSGNLIEDLNFDWDASSETWNEDDKTIFIYNLSNKLIEQTSYSWDFNASTFINDSRIQTTYDAFGLKTSQLELDWDRQNSTWLNVELFEVSYSQAKNPIKILIYSWSKTKQAWVNINLFLNNFDESVKGSQLILPVLDIFYLLFQFDAFSNGRPLAVAYYEQKKATGEWGSRNLISFHYSQHEVNRLSDIKKNTLKIYPNPIIEELICESEIENGYYTIISVEGLKIATGTYVNSEIISVSKIPAGMYTLLLQDSQKHTYQRSFIKL